MFPRRLPGLFAMTSQCQLFREPLWAMLARTVAIAAILGVALSAASHGGLRLWLPATVLMLWPSFGGHWVELGFLNGLRPRLSAARPVQVAARLAVWFVGGTILALGMWLTATALGAFQPARRPQWWLGGLAFIGIELVVHLVLQLRAKPSFYNRRG
jgi:hypothetical protein